MSPRTAFSSPPTSRRWARYGRGYRRVKFIFDVSDGTPIILYRQDLSRLGWALGDKARQTLLANNTTQ